MKHRKNVLLNKILDFDEQLTELRHLMGKNGRKSNKALKSFPYLKEDWYEANIREYLEILEAKAKYGS